MDGSYAVQVVALIDLLRRRFVVTLHGDEVFLSTFATPTVFFGHCCDGKLLDNLRDAYKAWGTA